MKYYYLQGRIKRILMPWYGVVKSGESTDDIRIAANAKELNKLATELRCPNTKCSGWKKNVKALDLVTPSGDLPAPIADRSQCLVTSAARGLQCARERLLQLLGWDNCERCLWLGRVIDLSGSACQDWLTIRSKQGELILRSSGSTDGKWPQEYTICPECGKIMYWPRVKPYYALESQLDGRPIYLSNCYHMVVRKDIFENIRAAKLLNLQTGEIRTSKEPLDGWSADFSQK